MEKEKRASLYRRDYQRFMVNGSASLVIVNEVKIPLILKDLSSRGVSVVGDYPFQINQTVTVIIYAPLFIDTPTLKQARTVWCKKTDENLWEAGLDFGMDSLIRIF